MAELAIIWNNMEELFPNHRIVLQGWLKDFWMSYKIPKTNLSNSKLPCENQKENKTILIVIILSNWKLVTLLGNVSY